MPFVQFVPPTQPIYNQHWTWPPNAFTPNRRGSTATGGLYSSAGNPHTNVGTVVQLVGSPWFTADLQMGNVCRMGENSIGAAQDQEVQFEGTTGPLGVALLPPGVRAPRERLITWYSLYVRWPGAVPQMRDGIGLAPVETGTGNWWTNDNPASVIGKAITISGGGDGTIRLYRKALNTLGPVAENLVLPWPRAITEWTEVWLVLLHATASSPARFRLYLDRQLVLERSWGVTGTGTGMPEWQTNSGAALHLRAVCLGATHPGVRMELAMLAVRQGEWDVNGAPLPDT
jgi:hypothetical protein